MKDETDAETDGGVPGALDQDELYALVHTAVKDAMLDVLGTVVLLGLALLFVGVGAQAAVTGTTTTAIVLGAVGTVLGVVIAATALDLVSPFRS